MKTMHLYFTVDPTPEAQVRLIPLHGECKACGVDVTIGDVESTVFFNSHEGRIAWLTGLRARIDAVLEPTTTAPDTSAEEALPAAQAAI